MISSCLLKSWDRQLDVCNIAKDKPDTGRDMERLVENSEGCAMTEPKVKLI